MGYTPDVSSKGGPVFNAEPNTVGDFNANREYAELVGNRKIGTTAERDAATGNKVWQGLEWFDTDLKRTFYYDETNGWEFQQVGTLTPNALYTTNPAWETPVLSKIEGRARLSGFLSNVSNITFVGSTVYPLATIPAGFRPAKTILRPAAPSPISQGQTWILIGSTGGVSFALQNGAAFTAGAWGIGFDMEWEATA